jgi:hypothetical protein
VLSVIDKAMLNGVNRPDHLKGYRAFVSITSRLECVKGVVGTVQGASQAQRLYINIKPFKNNKL